MSFTSVNWLIPPLTDDYERAQMSRILWHVLIWEALIGICITSAFGTTSEKGIAGLIFFGHAVVSLALTYRGAFSFPRITTPIFWYITGLYLCTNAHGIHDVTANLFPLTMIGASALLGRSGLSIFWAACVTAMGGMVYAETSGIMVTRLSHKTDILDFVYLTIIYSVITGTLWISLGYWNALLLRAKQNEHDLSKQRNAMETSEARFRAIADYTYNWESWVGPDGRLLWVNPAVERVTGYTAAECLEMDHYPSALIHEGDRALVRGFLDDPARSASGHEGEFRILRKNGDISWGAMTWQPIVDARGADAGYRTSVVDITEKKRVDAKHAALEKKLDQSQRMEAIGELAGGVAHDFNNLLLAIRGNAELLNRGKSLNAEDTQLVLEISKAAGRAADLTGQLLSFSRRQVIQPVPTDINELIGDLIGMLARLIPENIDLRFRPKATSSIISGDPGHLEQIIVNLILNARDAMEGGGKLVIETSNTSSHVLADELTTPLPGECLEIRVADTGAGMTPDVIERIFEPFFTTKPTGKGTGLGLSTVFGLVKQHRGVTRVQSEPGIGTEFKIFLPLALGAAVSKSPASIARAEVGHETIMVVEDEPMVLKLACRILESAGYTTIRCTNGQEAFDCYVERGDEIALVLCDVVMPVMGGEEAMRHLRKLDPNVRILFTSGYASEGVHNNFILNGGFDFLPKPYDPNMLLQKVRTALEQPDDPTIRQAQ